MPSLYRYVWYRVQDHALAEELTALICERALRILSRYDPAQGSFNAWMFGIARNEVRHMLRTIQRQPIHISLDAVFNLEARQPSVEQTFQTRETIQMALNLLGDLPDREREVIALRYGSGFSNREIAEVMAMSENHVAVVLHRALKKLRKALNAAFAEVDRSVTNAR